METLRTGIDKLYTEKAQMIFNAEKATNIADTSSLQGCVNLSEGVKSQGD